MEIHDLYVFQEEEAEEEEAQGKKKEVCFCFSSFFLSFQKSPELKPKKRTTSEETP